MRLVVIALVFLGAIGVLVGVGIQANSTPVMRYAQLAEVGSTREVIVDDARVVKIEQRFPSLKFTVAPEGHTGEPLQVVGEIAPPENFKDGGPVVIRGFFDPKKNEFRATKVTTKCPSRYNTKEEYERSQREEKAKAASPTQAN
ncbi:MAG: cytochrome c maturation protein CcmE [Planctomycetota bacterium]